MSQEPGIAIVGASADRRKFGNIAVRAYLDQGWRVYPVNPKGGEIEGVPVVSDVANLPTRLDRVSVYLPPDVLLGMLEALSAKAPRELWLNPGTESPEVLDRAAELGLAIVNACSIVDLGVSPRDYVS